MMGKKINYYYSIEGVNVYKYLVDLDYESLRKYRLDIINNCSDIKHLAYRTEEEPNWYDIDHYRNYHSKKSLSDKSLFVEYDYYNHSILVELIDKLLSGNMYVIDELKNSNCLKSNSVTMDNDKLIMEIRKLIFNGKYDKIDELVNSSLDEYKRNCFEKLTLEEFYLEKINSCIKLELVASISLEEFYKIKDFFEDCSSEHNVSSGLKKVLKPTDK